ncbi:MAG: alanine racemase [Oscillospiraceae bacterium]
MDPKEKRTWVEVSLQAIEENYKALRRLTGANCRFLGIVKANGYGHGAVEVATLLQKLGADYLAVACLDEAVKLRTAGLTMPILILGATPVEFAPALLNYDITQTVFDYETGVALSEAAKTMGKTLKIHIKVDTGMSRLGFFADEGQEISAAREIGKLKALPNLHLEGIFTHFSDADGSESYTMSQLNIFLQVVDRLEREEGIHFEIRHCAASSAVINYSCTHLDMIRPGLALYGMYPGENMESVVKLRPAMSLKTRVVAVRHLPKGACVSYGRTHTLERDSVLAVLPIGYADGLHRVCSDGIEVLVKGRRAKQIGRICMDLCMVDVTDIPGVCLGDICTLFGQDEGAVLPVEEMAKQAGTISYELVCVPSPRVPRIYI